MPIYEYEHLEQACDRGQVFEVKQSIKEASFTQCPTCLGPVRKRISRISIAVQKSNTELRDMGLTKLVKRDNGVYENVTRREGESRYMEAGKPETMPDLSRIISD
jgi:putative FmdB family regulatory protein